MLEDLFYRRETITDIDAAVVGVSRLRWKALHSRDATAERAQEIMRSHQFDVLPVMEDDETVQTYFRTTSWGDYSEVVQCGIEYEDVIPQQTSLRTVVQGFAEQKRHFFFLANEHYVTGLISIVNLNCRQARIFFFSLLSEMEVRLSRLVQSEINQGRLAEPDLLEMANEDVRRRYQTDRANGVERDLVEYLYLSTLCTILRKQELYPVLGFATGKQLKQVLGGLVELRNEVAHPQRSIIRKSDAAVKLWKNIVAIERVLFYLRRWESDAG